mgnify:CR=1 FL=1
MTLSVEERYQAEIKQSDIDHHTPTAGAMTGHIVANLAVLINKLQQAKWYVRDQIDLPYSLGLAIY